MMGFFNFLGKKDNDSKKKTGSIKKQVMQVLNPKIAATDYYAESKKKKSNRHPKKNQKIKTNLEMIYDAIFYGSKSWTETC